VKKQGVFHGAVVLAVAGFIVKVLGALFKIPLGAMLGPEGNGIFSIAHNIYALIFVIATAGIPVAMSKIVAEVEAKGENSKIVFKKALILFAVMGLGAHKGSVLTITAVGEDADDALRGMADAMMKAGL